MDKSFRLRTYEDYDDNYSYFSTEEELINTIISWKLTPNDFEISKILNPRDYVKYNDSLDEIYLAISQNLENSKIRLEELNKQKKESSILLKENVYIFDQKIKEEEKSIKENMKRLENCKI